MGHRADGNGAIRPCYRTKSPQRSFEEVQWLYRRFGRRTFGWVDPTFNASAEWSDQWAERMLGFGIDGRPRPAADDSHRLDAGGLRGAGRETRRAGETRRAQGCGR